MKYKTIYYPGVSEKVLDEFLTAKLDEGLELVAASSGFYHFRVIDTKKPATFDECVRHISALRSDGMVYPEELVLIEEVVNFINREK